jgi:hypothetical protein
MTHPDSVAQPIPLFTLAARVRPRNEPTSDGAALASVPRHEDLPVMAG